MIADVVGNYLDTLEEREFDAPFIALLRAMNFCAIHFLHGGYEFGKDFIAQGQEDGTICQFAFQTKAGNMDLGEWKKVLGQIDLLRSNSLAHPGYDLKLPRRPVLVLTGRLTGGAPLAAQDYGKYLDARGEPGFKVWDRETLVSLMNNSPEVGLAGTTEGTFLKLIGKIDTNEILESELERFSRHWYVARKDLWRSVLEAGILANRLQGHNRIDLACFTALCLIRATWACGHDQDPPSEISLAVADLGQKLFQYYASAIWRGCRQDLLDPLKLIGDQEGPSAYFTYPVRCIKIAEILGLLGLLFSVSGEPRANEIVEHLCRFFDKNPGATHPISDRWAVSLIPPVLLLAKTGHKVEIESIFRGVIRWIGDRYEKNNIGLAGPYANPEEEINYLLGNPFEHVKITRRPESYVSTVILDLSALLGMGEVYELARNDFRAVEALPCVLEMGDGPGQYQFDHPGLKYEPNMDYKDIWDPKDGWKVAPHHGRSPNSFYLGRIGRAWDHLAVSCVMRDRHFLPSCQDILR